MSIDVDNIRSYASLMKEMGLTALEINENGSTVRLERTIPAVSSAVQQQIPQVVSLDAVAAAGSGIAAQASVTAGVGSDNISGTLLSGAAEHAAGLVEVTSPMVGVFYCAPGENEKPYVRVGDRVKKGDVLCVIEAMKLMNEITTECDGVIEEVCVNNGQVVDFGYVMFRISKE